MNILLDQEIGEKNLEGFLDVLVQQLPDPDLRNGLPELTHRAFLAGDFCTAYPHLDKKVVMMSLVLLSLIKSGCLKGGIEEVIHVLDGLIEDAELRFRIVNVLVEAQTDYASGEAKIVQYFYH